MVLIRFYVLFIFPNHLEKFKFNLLIGSTMEKILVVEDEGITSFELKTKLENWGYSVVGVNING